MRLSDLQGASFNGVPFLVPSDNGKQGPNTVVHNHPGGTQSNEWNGTFSGEYKVTAILHGGGLVAKLNRLLAVLDAPRAGLLRHPYLGSKLCNVKGPYSYKRNDSRAGIIELEITFKEQTSAALGLVAIPAMVSTMAGQVVSGLFSPLNLPQVKTGLLTNKSLQVISSSFGQISNAFSKNFSQAAEVMRAAAFLRKDSFPAELFDSKSSDGLETLINLYREPFESEYSNQSLFDGFKSIDKTLQTEFLKSTKMESYTPDLALRKTVLSKILSLNKAATLASLSEAMAAKSYQTADEVMRDRIYLEARKNELYGF